MIWLLRTLLNDHHDNSGNHLSPYKVIIDHITYAVFISLWFIYYITGDLYLLIPFTYFAQPSTTLYLAFFFLVVIHLFSVSMSLFLLCFLDPLINEIMQYLSFSNLFYLA